jgi:hypothetical protein
MERSKGRRPVRARQAMALPKRGAGTLGPASSGGCACALHIKWV